MLVLSRKPGELIRIGSDVQIMVLGIRGERVRMGLTAPAEVPILRQEVADRISRRERTGTAVAKPLATKIHHRRATCADVK